MNQGRLARYVHILPLVIFLVVAAVFSSSSGSSVYEPPLLLPLLNTVLLAVFPFAIAAFAVRAYMHQGFPVFILYGCGMVAFGVGSLIAGWGLVRFGQNFTVTVHNVGSLIGGLCHLGAVGTLFLGQPPRAKPTPRAGMFTVMAGFCSCVLVLLAVSFLAANGSFPTFFVQNQGPTAVRQAVLAAAAIAYALGGIVMVDLHAQTRESLFRLYASALFLMAIGLGIVLSARSVGSILSWTGRAAQYAASLYFIAAVGVGSHRKTALGSSLPTYLHQALNVHIDKEVQSRTRDLAELNEKLRRSEERLRLAAEATGFGFYSYDFRTNAAYYSAEFLQLFGLPPDGTLAPGNDFTAKALHPEDRAAFLSAMNAANDPRGSGIIDLEYRILRTDGEERWLRVRGRTTFRDDSAPSRPSQTNGIVQDITERKKAGQELLAREETYRSALDNSLQGIAILQEGRIVFCNEGLSRMSGYTKEEICLMAPEQVLATVYPEDRIRAAEALAAFGRGGEGRPVAVLRLIHKTGTLRWVELMAAQTTYQGHPAHQLSYVDVTELRNAESAYRLLIEQAAYGMAIIQDGRIIFCNRAFADLCGYSVNELLRLTPEESVRLIHADDAGKVIAYMTELLEGADPGPVRQFRFVHRDGSVRWADIVAARIELDGAPALQATYKDVSAEKLARDRLEEAHLKMRNLAVHLLHAREEERRRVAQEVHDDLGQQLAALKMDLHWLEKRLSPHSPAVGERLKGMLELGENALSVVQRIASDLRPRMLDDLGLAPALKQLGADFSRRSGIDCRVTTDFPAAVVGGNAATALYRFTQESLSNVARHSKSRHAAVHLSAANGELVLRVEDDGIGITTAQAHAADSYGLIGLRERVEGLAGSLSISGERGSGTVLTAKIPLPKEGGLA